MNYAFQPSNQGPFQFQPTLDGISYNAVITWNIFGQRWYINLYDSAGNLIFCQAVVGSPSGLILQGAAWVDGVVTATTVVPHGYAPGTTLALTISGVLPDAYNGAQKILVTGPSTFTYQLSGDPGPPTALGIASYNINMAFNYFQTSTLVYRQANAQFEVNP
jgi:hypothetical protein